MEALQKKCMAASMGVHLLAGAFLVVGSAMLVKEPVGRQFQAITMVPDALVDGALATGGSPQGSPNAQTAPQPEAPAPSVAQTQQQQPQQQQQQQPEPQRPAPVPAPTKPVTPARPVVTPPKPSPRTPTPVLSAPPSSANAAKPTHTVDVNLKPVVRKQQTKPAAQVKRRPEPDPQDTAEADEKAAAEAAATAAANAANAARQRQAAWDARARQFGNSLASLQKGLTSGGVTAMPFGPGGTAVADYGAYVVSLYDRAWRSPEDVQDNSASVRAKIVVARDGHIVSAEIVRKSGYPAMDASVRAALDRVTNVGRPFPEDATDKERTYFFNFNLKDKRGLG